ncbi:MAG: leucyl/phenylalanyl-tRNA--protein transferase [Kiritimatiellaceae bacterium]|nr:leucyl/phenylalanyl-tRNA--protein transferase [Kiritimatiellaceae bacterium]
MESSTKVLFRRIRRLGFRQHLYSAQVYLQSGLFPPPPKGRLPPVWMTTRIPPYGLLARGGELTPDSLLFAYSKGVIPIQYKGSVNWWSCNPRMVLFFDKMKISRQLRSLLKSGRFRVTFDTAFEEVVLACSDRKETWLIPERIDIALALHKCGRAHSVEVWNRDGRLIGGDFGVDLGRIFLSESSFHRESNVSKIAYIYLNCHLQHWGYLANDIGSHQDYCQKLGYENIPRRRYLELLRKSNLVEIQSGNWSVDEALNVANWIPSKPGSQRVSEKLSKDCA